VIGKPVELAVHLFAHFGDVLVETIDIGVGGIEFGVIDLACADLFANLIDPFMQLFSTIPALSADRPSEPIGAKNEREQRPAANQVKVHFIPGSVLAWLNPLKTPL